jgi:hypothetical protein
MSEEYERVLKWANALPDWKKKFYNDNYATSAHAKKLELNNKEEDK